MFITKDATLIMDCERGGKAVCSSWGTSGRGRQNKEHIILGPASRADTWLPVECSLNSVFIHSLSKYFLNTNCVQDTCLIAWRSVFWSPQNLVTVEDRCTT